MRAIEGHTHPHGETPTQHMVEPHHHGHTMGAHKGGHGWVGTIWNGGGMGIMVGWWNVVGVGMGRSVDIGGVGKG